jgi:hypothetical protein
MELEVKSWEKRSGVIYFQDTKIGLLAVSAEFPPTHAVKYSRFSELARLSAPNRNDLIGMAILQPEAHNTFRANYSRSLIVVFAGTSPPDVITTRLKRCLFIWLMRW